MECGASEDMKNYIERLLFTTEGNRDELLSIFAETWGYERLVRTGEVSYWGSTRFALIPKHRKKINIQLDSITNS